MRVIPDFISNVDHSFHLELVHDPSLVRTWENAESLFLGGVSTFTAKGVGLELWCFWSAECGFKFNVHSRTLRQILRKDHSVLSALDLWGFLDSSLVWPFEVCDDRKSSHWLILGLWLVVGCNVCVPRTPCSYKCRNVIAFGNGVVRFGCIGSFKAKQVSCLV